MALVTILAREMRLKFFEVDQRLEMLRVALVTILAREMRLKFFQVDQRLEMLRMPLGTILAREMRLKFFEVDQRDAPFPTLGYPPEKVQRHHLEVISVRIDCSMEFPPSLRRESGTCIKGPARLQNTGVWLTT